MSAKVHKYSSASEPIEALRFEGYKQIWGSYGEDIEDAFNVIPTSDHYGCRITGLGGHGKFTSIEFGQRQYVAPDLRGIESLPLALSLSFGLLAAQPGLPEWCYLSSGGLSERGVLAHPAQELALQATVEALSLARFEPMGPKSRIFWFGFSAEGDCQLLTTGGSLYCAQDWSGFPPGLKDQIEYDFPAISSYFSASASKPLKRTRRSKRASGHPPLGQIGSVLVKQLSAGRPVIDFNDECLPRDIRNGLELGVFEKWLRRAAPDCSRFEIKDAEQIQALVPALRANRIFGGAYYDKELGRFIVRFRRLPMVWCGGKR